MTKDRSIILTIREYENSVDMPDEERVTYLDPRGGVHLKDGDDRSQEYTDYAEESEDIPRTPPHSPFTGVYGLCGGVRGISSVRR